MVLPDSASGVPGRRGVWRGHGTCWRGRWPWGPGLLPLGAAGLPGPAPQGEAGELVGVASTQEAGLTTLAPGVKENGIVTHSLIIRGLVIFGGMALC